MALTETDRNLLDSCLTGEPCAWEALVDRFIGLVIHVVDHTARAKGVDITVEDREDLAADVFARLVRKDFRILRDFRRKCSLATYLTVIARRVTIRQLHRRIRERSLQFALDGEPKTPITWTVEQRVEDRDQIEAWLEALSGLEAEVVRRFHLEGLSYEEISRQLGIPVNSVGPTLSRARLKIRRNNSADSVFK
ncbi:MAG: RNA polymerase sigma factor [Blastopirellula sp. JB062]